MTLIKINTPVSTKNQYDRAKRILKPIFLPFNRYITYHGLENIIREGPNLIVANHPGIGRDIAGIVTAYERQLHFLAAHYMFDEEVFLQKHIKPALGSVLYKFLSPVAKRFSWYLTGKMKELDMIPINKEFNGNLAIFASNLRAAFTRVKEFLLNGRAVSIFQITYNILRTIGQKKIVDKEPSKYHSYIPRFSPTFGKIAFELYKDHGLLIPITPIGIYGAEGLNPFKRMVLNIGKPMDISTCLEANLKQDPVSLFTDRLECRIADLLIEAGLPGTNN
ncbi:MAG: hypothetical protein ISS81_09745 [Candidatus Marinimicrobia bacterium]|nr:hypothetical protein [Candidatus Neomarinimicrobiota bacterium]